MTKYAVKTVKGFGIIVLLLAYRGGRVLVHPAPVLLHRLQVLELLIAYVAVEALCPAYAKEPHAY
jgi:hypothetical protein